METFITSKGTTIIVHRPNLTPEEYEKRMDGIKEATTMLMKRGRRNEKGKN